MTESDVMHWTPILHRMAQGLWRHRAWQHPATLIDDLTQVGWLSLVQYGPDHPHANARARYDMLTFLLSWLYGIPAGTSQETRTRWPSGLRTPVPLTTRREGTTRRTIEEDTLDRALGRQVWAHLSPPAQAVLAATVDRYPHRLQPGDVEMSPVTVRHYRQMIRRTGEAYLSNTPKPRFHRHPRTLEVTDA